MPSPVVHFEIRSADPDGTRSFFGKLFGWTFPDGGMPGYSYVDTGAEGAIPGGISPLQDGEPLMTFFVGVQDVAATLEAAVAEGGRIIQPQPPYLESPSGCWPTRTGRWSDWPGQAPEVSGGAPGAGGTLAGEGNERTAPADPLLLARAAAGDDAAFAALMEPHQRPVFRHCYRMLGSGADAEDATQDTLERAWRKLATYDGSGPFGAWL
jgi:predicted enzyme related to lactoylglutathione lyase